MWVHGHLILGLAIMTGAALEVELAYVGPGTGLAVIGAALAFVAGILMGILGFVWYPFKRAYRALTGKGDPSPDPPPE